MTSFVTVCYQARQYKITTTPGKIINDVLSEAKARIGLDGPCLLRYGKTNIDLSLPIRLARLPNGAKIDLIKSSSTLGAKVNIALDILGSPRRTKIVNAADTLWAVLSSFEDDRTRTISAFQEVDGRRCKFQCRLQLNNKEYGDDTQLKSVTLESLGIVNGSAVMRLSFRPTDETVDTGQAVPVQIPQTLAPVSEPDPRLSSTTDTVQPAITSSNIVRKIEVLAPSKVNIPISASINLDEEDLKLSVDQAKSYQASLAQRSKASQAPMTTQAYRASQAEERRSRLRPDICRVKFKFPDGMQIVSEFRPDETSLDLYFFVDSVCSSRVAYELELAGRKERLRRSEQALWQDLQMTKAVVVYIIAAAGSSISIKNEYRALAQDISTVQKQHSPAVLSEGAQPEDTFSTREPTDQPKEKKIPKWLQKSLGKK